ncbi:MAG: serine/threonine-protein kinase, partial [Planctomycetota bacterium]|nr:serine/threonine-protein kinase [Planctomycetota bacterium]
MYNSAYSSETSSSWSNPNYELISELGRGGMGIVYKARRLSDQSILAVKVLPPHFADPEFLIRFQRETQVLAQLDHPHIVKVYDYGEQSSPFFAMEVMEGKDLKELFEDRLRLTGQPFRVEEAIDLIAPIAEALAHCHSQNILHRDIKLANIFIKDGGHPVLVDFGLSKQSNENSHGSYEKTLSKTGEILGTVAYMSPEQLSPNGDYGAMGPATDVWSLGTALFLLLTCHFPYPAVSAIQLYMKIVESPIPVISDMRPDVPRWLTHLLFQMLSKHSSERPTMEVVARTLRGLDEEYSSAVLHEKLQPKTPNTYFSLSSLALVITVPASLILAFFLWQSQSVLQLNELDQPPAYVSRKKIILKGQLNQGPVTISVGGRKDVSKVDGRFELSIPLKEGVNFIELSFSNGRGKDLTRSYTIRRDTKAPIIQWTLPGKDKSQAYVEIDDCGSISGSIIETSLSSLTVNKTN